MITRQEARKELVADLRSGKFKQIQKRLGTEEGRCCLGVACEVAVRHKVIPPAILTEGEYIYLGWDQVMPPEVRDFFGFLNLNSSYSVPVENPDGLIDLGWTSLAAMNDKGSTFAEIADVIESEPKGLFVD